MFGLKMSGCTVYALNTYAEAAAFHDNCPTSGGMRDGLHRAISGKTGSKIMGVRMTAGGPVSFRYHSTDVVVWYPDGTYEVDLTYTSSSTCAFANRFIPKGCYATTSARQFVAPSGTYPAGVKLRVTPDGAVTAMSRTAPRFRKKMVNRDRAKRSLQESGAADYLRWYKTMYPLVRDSAHSQLGGLDKSDLCEMFADPDRYHRLIMHPSGRPPRVREIVYERYDVYDWVYADRLARGASTAGWEVELHG
jgi:hypothetical protein